MESRTWAKGRTWWVEASKPAGGFVLVREGALWAAWTALRDGRIELLDLRVWLAAFELVERRLASGAKRQPRYCREELRRLVGGEGARTCRGSFARLRMAGLLECAPASIRMLGGRGGLPCEGRWVPIPRPLLRHLASARGRAYIATALGHLLRCLFLRNKLCRSGGYVKASWIAESFGVAQRSVKEARGALVERGFLVVLAADQSRLNRLGAPVVINLTLPNATDSAPPISFKGSESAPPEKHDQLSLRRSGNQQPARSADPTAACTGVGPTLRDVKPADLKDARRLASLFEQATERGLVQHSEADRLAFFAAALHARRVGTRNACGLFAWTVWRRKYEVLSQDDEDRARRALVRFRAGTDVPTGDPARNAAAGSALPTAIGQVTSSLMACITHPVSGTPSAALRQPGSG